MSVSHAFTCRQCGKTAGIVGIYGRGEPRPSIGVGDRWQEELTQIGIEEERPRLLVTSGIADTGVYEFNLNLAATAITAGDATALFQIDQEIVPFWCPTCPASYCARHWTTRDTFDETFFDARRQLVD